MIETVKDLQPMDVFRIPYNDSDFIKVNDRHKIVTVIRRSDMSVRYMADDTVVSKIGTMKMEPQANG